MNDIINEQVLDIFKTVEDYLKDTPAIDRGAVKNQYWWQGLVTRLKGKDSLLLGSGYFSGAFTHPTDDNKVIKIGFKKEDSGAAYAAFCRQHQGEYGVPEIYFLDRFKSVYVVVMKRYVTYAEGVSYQEARNSRHDILEGADSERAYNQCRYVLRDECLTRKKHAIVDFSKKIYNFFNGVARFDIHNENIMFDMDTDSLIITDPVSFSEDSKAMVRLEAKLGLKPVNMKPEKGIAINRKMPKLKPCNHELWAEVRLNELCQPICIDNHTQNNFPVVRLAKNRNKVLNVKRGKRR